MGVAEVLGPSLVGKVVSRVRALESFEVENLGWFCDVGETLMLEFDDDSFALVMCDPEGNGPGFLELGSYLSYEDDSER